MQQLSHIAYLIFFLSTLGYSQVPNAVEKQIQIKGEVRTKKSRSPLSGINVSTDRGAYAKTNGMGEFEISASLGDELIIESPEIETIRHHINSGEDILILVQDLPIEAKSKRNSKSSAIELHRSYLDSANFYKKSDIQKSIDFITQSIATLGSRENKPELARSLTMLGEVYQYHKQYDLAITSYKDALVANKNIRTTLLLGRVSVLNKNYKDAENVVKPLLELKDIEADQKVTLYEVLGDVYKGQNLTDKAIAFYEEGLKVARMNQIAPKLVDLNSKIADIYAENDQGIEAEGYYQNSLKLAVKQAPQRAIEEKEKVADFYNQKSRFSEEIQLRKENLTALGNIPATKSNKNAEPKIDSISAQRINYKIASAYIAQDKLDEAIPYLQRSITGANIDDDLIVQKDATRKLSEVYKYKGDFTKALASYQEYVALVDTLYRKKEQEISSAARFNREISERQSRIKGLEQERELSQSKYDLAVTEQRLFQELNKMQSYIIYSLIIGLLLMGLATYFFYRSNQQQKLANNLLALKSLRSQMNPHFIFNALNSVNNYIAKNDERSANRYLSDFSTLMRSVLENSEEDFIPLSKEIELLRLYVKLEHSRFPEKFDYEINVAEEVAVDSFEIPPMLIQPYVENAIWHGLRYKEEQGFLHIIINELNDTSIEILIKDNGIGRKKSAELKTKNQRKQKSKGMGNVRKRVAILNEMYKDRVSVEISNLQGGETGTQVRIILKQQ